MNSLLICLALAGVILASNDNLHLDISFTKDPNLSRTCVLNLQLKNEQYRGQMNDDKSGGIACFAVSNPSCKSKCISSGDQGFAIELFAKKDQGSSPSCTNDYRVYENKYFE